MAKCLYKSDWEHHLGGGDSLGKGCFVAIHRMLGTSKPGTTKCATDFLSDPRHPGTFSFRTRLKADPANGKLQRIMTFWISDPDVAFEFKLRFG